MKLINNAGLVIMAVWLIIKGLAELFRLTFTGMDLILPLVAIFAGVLLLLRIRDSSMSVNLGFLLLSVWFILTGLIPLLGVSFPELYFVMAILGLAAGILILISQ
jgi:hypothetical protein